jgi:hypothetical protein
MHQRMVVGLSWSTMVRSCCAGSYVCVSVFVVELCGWVRGWLRLMIMVGGATGLARPAQRNCCRCGYLSKTQRCVGVCRWGV